MESGNVDAQYLVSSRESILDRINATLEFFQEQPKKVNPKKLKAHFAGVDELRSAYNAIETQILMFNAKAVPKDKITYKNERKEVDAKFAVIIEEYETRMEVATILEEPKTSSHLPKITIPTFSGLFRNWHSFKELFISLIHNTSLPNVEKFQRLKSYLQGDALKLVSHLDLSAENYEIAFDMLLSRYDNPRLAANAHLNSVLGYKQATNDSFLTLQDYLTHHLDPIKAYKVLNINDHFDYLLFQLSYNHLDPQTQRAFDNKFPVDVFPTYNDLINFVQTQLRTMEMHSADTGSKCKNVKGNVKHSFNVMAGANVSDQSPSVSPCYACAQNHPLYICPKFCGLSVQEKYALLKANNLCFNCFKGHQRKACNSTKRCKKCHQQHHSLLHIERTKVNDAQSQPQTIPEANALFNTMINNIVTPFTSILLGTARGYMRSKTQKSFIPVRILLDPGSQVSCMSEELASALGVTIKPQITKIKGLAGMSSRSLGVANCRIYVKPNSDESISANLVVLPTVTVNLPKIDVLPSIRHKFRTFKLADPKFDKAGPIDVLIGADYYYDVIIDGPIIKGKPNGIRTMFGLVLIGPIPTLTDSNTKQSFLVTQEPLDTLLSKFWEVEDVPIATPPSNDVCESLFQETIKRTPSGRYVVALPFLSDNPDCSLGGNRENALQRLAGMERRFQKVPNLKAEYSKFMNEYLELGHMSIAKTPSKYVIPHHAVFKASTTTKLRVVFDASNPSHTGMSLNQLLHKGPKLQQDLFLTLSGFRAYKIALVADIEKMYRQVLVRQEDRKWQHIFWRNEPTEPPIEYELHTVTYGLASSSYLAQRVIRQLVQDEGKGFPLASKALTQQIYVDDIISGGSTTEEALQLYSELTNLLGKGGFFPRKWSSSSPEVLAKIPMEHKETPMQLQGEGTATYKVLGLLWDPSLDAFSYKVENFEGEPTKRTVLSYISRIFDPLGWLSPFVFSCKHVIQLLWLEGKDWDAPLSPNLQKLWSKITASVQALAKIRIPRHIPLQGADEITVLGFCDASEKGYAAVLFLRCMHNDSILVRLLAGKSKVAPIKPLSIPKLELNAALLLAKLFNSFKPYFQNTLNKYNTLLFSDSQIVLGWLRTPPHKLKTYVCNRIVEILENTPPQAWYYVKSEENPSDCGSRGLSPEELLNCPLWWNGPQFLYKRCLNPPRGTKSDDGLPELKAEPKVVLVNIGDNTNNSEESILRAIEKFSSLSKATRVFAYSLRFINRVRYREINVGPLKVSELRLALQKYILLSQSAYFRGEIKKLRAQALPESLKTLNPFLDQHGLLRVGGRLKEAPLPFNAKHPILIPYSSPLARLIVEQCHKTTLHGGPQTMRSEIQSTYWIPKIGHLIKAVVFGCGTCRRFKVKSFTPIMADLPPTRFDQIRPFTRSGVDFAGPFNVKETTRRKAFVFKSYVCLFVCFSTKATHLEVVNSLTTASLLAAIDRFISRRGICSFLHSDNGTNFVGAAKRLSEVQDILTRNTDIIAEKLSMRQVQWMFNPPSAPHFGGLWEAAVKAFKSHFTKITGSHTFTLEEFITLTCRVEAILNSRPLCPLTNPNDDTLCLTPGHFLIGSALLALPEQPLTDVAVGRLNRWQLISQNIQYFWKKWRNSYLQTLMCRRKWNVPQEPISVGDIVILKNVNTSPLIWPLARVVETVPGRDGVPRVARVYYNGRTLTRPVHMLCKIPITE